MHRMRNRGIILAVALIVVAVLLSCSSGGRLGRSETGSPTPTKTPRPTFTATLPPTETPIPTNTPLPTDTPTPVPPTNTPVILTATPTEEPTAEPTPVPPTATQTKPPTPRPATKTPTPKPPPTNTAAPQFQWSGQVVWDVRYQANCGGVGISKESTIRDKSGTLLNGIHVLLDCYGNLFVSHPSGNPGEYDPGHYDFWGLSTQPVDYSCTLRICDANGVPVPTSQTVTVTFDTGPCAPGESGHQVAIVNWTKNY